jgi:hypothetical protein
MAEQNFAERMGVKSPPQYRQAAIAPPPPNVYTNCYSSQSTPAPDIAQTWTNLDTKTAPNAHPTTRKLDRFSLKIWTNVRLYRFSVTFSACLGVHICQSVILFGIIQIIQSKITYCAPPQSELSDPPALPLCYVLRPGLLRVWRAAGQPASPATRRRSPRRQSATSGERSTVRAGCAHAHLSRPRTEPPPIVAHTDHAGLVLKRSICQRSPYRNFSTPGK